MTVYIDGSSGITNVNGSASTPADRSASNNTGFYFPTSTSFGIATAGVSRAIIDANGVFAYTGAANQNISALGNTSGTITLDLATANNFSFTLNANATNTLANPSNLVPGQSGIIFITQDATGSRLLSFGSYWKFPGGSTPVISTAASTTDAIVYTVRSSTSILAQALINCG
jgi:hypothetical protein